MNHPSSMDHHEEDEEEEDFIDIQVSSSSSSSNLFCYTINSPPKAAIEFEFQMSSAPSERASTTSPADELFYKGKLLPLHLPPRLQMVQKLLQNTTFDTNKTKLSSSSSFEDENTTISTLIPFTTTNTPLESCNISPSESCRVSSELNPDEHFFDWSNELSGFISDTNHPKKPWSKKLKLIKQSLITQKLKASRAYLKSIFTKSVCSDKSCSKPASSTIGEQPPTRHHDSIGKKSPLGKTGKVAYYPTLASVMSTDKEMVEEAAVISHRKSFSGAFKRQSAAATKCCSSSSSSSSSSGASSLSSSFSVNSSGLFELEFFKRSGSGNSEIENSIEGAIAHCKQSQQVFSSISASRIAVSEDKER